MWVCEGQRDIGEQEEMAERNWCAISTSAAFILHSGRLEALSNPKARPESKNMRARRTGTRLTASTPKKKPSSSGGSTGVGDTRSKSKLK